jgi:hypothetical protein
MAEKRDEWGNPIPSTSRQIARLAAHNARNLATQAAKKLKRQK